MAEEEHLKILQQGVEAWNAWRKQNPSTQPELDGANLHKVDLRGINLSDASLININLQAANLSHADLTFTWLWGANLAGANLSFAKMPYGRWSGVNLSGADLRSSDLHSTDLSSARLVYADLRAASLSGASLYGTVFDNTLLNETEFSGADCGQTIFANVDLSTAKGLDTTDHFSSSTVGVDTIYVSGGQIPAEFLRGCGVPEAMIAFAQGLAGKTADYYSYFINYRYGAEEFGALLAQQLQAEKLRVWHVESGRYGGRIHTWHSEENRLHDRRIIVLTKEAMRGRWAPDTFQMAIRREKEENRHILFPIRLFDNRTFRWLRIVTRDGIDITEEVRKFQIYDFSKWRDPDKFRTQFQKLLADLRNP